MKKIAVFVLLCLAPVLFTACGKSGPKLHQVSGSVTYKGVPVEEGSIVFSPESPNLSPVGGNIKNGTYACQVYKGKMSVQISGAKRIPGTGVDQGRDIWVGLIPDNQPAQTLEVTGEMTKDFHLE